MMNQKDDPTITAYNLYSDVYDNETKEFWENFPKSTINSFIKSLPGNKILDLGSGPGRDAILLRDKGLDVTCLDASEKMVERTNNLGFVTVKSDLRNIPFEDNTFDGVWAYTSLLHIKKDEVSEVLKKIYKLLKQNGVFLIGMIEGEFEGNKLRDSMPNTYRYFRFYEERELRDLVENAGFVFRNQERYKPLNNVYLSQIYVKHKSSQRHS